MCMRACTGQATRNSTMTLGYVQMLLAGTHTHTHRRGWAVLFTYISIQTSSEELPDLSSGSNVSWSDWWQFDPFLASCRNVEENGAMGYTYVACIEGDNRMGGRGGGGKGRGGGRRIQGRKG